MATKAFDRIMSTDNSLPSNWTGLLNRDCETNFCWIVVLLTTVRKFHKYIKTVIKARVADTIFSTKSRILQS